MISALCFDATSHFVSFQLTPANTIRRALFAIALALPLCAHALDFIVDDTRGIIRGTGDVTLGDAEALKKILTLEFRQEHHNVRGLVRVELDSPGGSMLGGILLGYVLRSLGTHTHVGAGDACLSACAMAFLGGQRRTVEGHYGVHAAGFLPSSNVGSITNATDAIQALGGITTAFVHEMTGSNKIAVRAMSTRHSKISLLTDEELVDMKAITLALRPSQHGKTGFRCPSGNATSILGIVCTNLDIAEMDRELNEIYADIKRMGAPAGLDSVQQKWLRYRNSCIHSTSPNGFQSIVGCVKEAYEVRRDQLLSIQLSLAASKTAPGSRNWEPLTPE